jgi:uncharacterized RDD family membrane protein YckC
MDLNDTKTFTTPEQVAITYSLAGIGTRFAALLVDTLLEGLLLLTLLIGFGLVTLGAGEVGDWLFTFWDSVSGWVAAALMLAVFLLLWGYFIFWETVWSGQTPGKRLCGIRVLRDGGFPIDFRAAFIRNVMRFVDALPFCYGAGALTMFISKESKRLGDYAAGTIVVADARRGRLVKEASAAAPAPPTPEYRLLGDPALLNLRALTREQFAVVERYLARRKELAEKVRLDLAQQIATPLFSVIGLEPPAGEYPYDEFLTELAAAYRRRAG